MTDGSRQTLSLAKTGEEGSVEVPCGGRSEEALRQAVETIADATRREFYGTVEVKVKAGCIVAVLKHETVKLG